MFAGFVVGVAVQLVLTLLGLAIGASSTNLHDSQPAERIPLGTETWTGLSLLISAFMGGLVTSRLSYAPLRSDGMVDNGRGEADQLFLKRYLFYPRS